MGFGDEPPGNCKHCGRNLDLATRIKDSYPDTRAQYYCPYCSYLIRWVMAELPVVIAELQARATFALAQTFEDLRDRALAGADIAKERLDALRRIQREFLDKNLP